MLEDDSSPILAGMSGTTLSLQIVVGNGGHVIGEKCLDLSDLSGRESKLLAGNFPQFLLIRLLLPGTCLVCFIQGIGCGSGGCGSGRGRGCRIPLPENIHHSGTGGRSCPHDGGCQIDKVDTVGAVLDRPRGKGSTPSYRRSDPFMILQGGDIDPLAHPIPIAVCVVVAAIDRRIVGNR